MELTAELKSKINELGKGIVRVEWGGMVEEVDFDIEGENFEQEFDNLREFLKQQIYKAAKK